MVKEEELHTALKKIAQKFTGVNKRKRVSIKRIESLLPQARKVKARPFNPNGFFHWD